MFKPLRKKLVVKRDEKRAEINGIVVPEEAQKREIFGTVAAVGPEVIKDLIEGTRVFFGPGDGVVIDEKYFEEPGDYIIMEESQVRGIVNGTLS